MNSLINSQLPPPSPSEADEQFTLGKSLYEAAFASETGYCRPQDQSQAVRLYRKSALLGYPPAQNAIGFLHATGRGVVKNEILACQWFGLAAKSGCSGAEMNLGVMFSEGRGVKTDETEALCYFYRAAMSGNCEAQEFLAHALQDGLCGLSQDSESAEFGLSNLYLNAAVDS